MLKNSIFLRFMYMKFRPIGGLKFVTMYIGTQNRNGSSNS